MRQVYKQIIKKSDEHNENIPKREIDFIITYRGSLRKKLVIDINVKDDLGQTLSVKATINNKNMKLEKTYWTGKIESKINTNNPTKYIPHILKATEGYIKKSEFIKFLKNAYKKIPKNNTLDSIISSF